MERRGKYPFKAILSGQIGCFSGYILALIIIRHKNRHYHPPTPRQAHKDPALHSILSLLNILSHLPWLPPSREKINSAESSKDQGRSLSNALERLCFALSLDMEPQPSFWLALSAALDTQL